MKLNFIELTMSIFIFPIIVGATSQKVIPACKSVESVWKTNTGSIIIEKDICKKYYEKKNMLIKIGSDTIPLGILEYDGGEPIISEVFTANADLDSNEEIVVISSIHQIHRAENFNVEAYTIKIFDMSLSNVGTKQFYEAKYLQSEIGSGDIGNFGGENCTFKYATSAEIKKYLLMECTAVQKALLEKKNAEQAHSIALSWYKSRHKSRTIMYLDSYCTDDKIAVESIPLYNDYGFFLWETGRFADAKKVLQKVVAISPSRTVAYFNLADAYAGLGDTVNARKNYQIYIDQMKKSGKAAKIPARVLNAVK